MFNTKYNYEFNDTCCEAPNTEPSMTVPDMSLTVTEILQRFTSNTLPPIAKNAYYDEDPSFDDVMDPNRIPDFDLADATALLNDLDRRKVARENNHSAELLRQKKVETDKKIDDGKAIADIEKVDGKSADA